MRRVDRWLLATLAPLWALALLLSTLSLDRNEVVSPLRAEGAPHPQAHPVVSSVPRYVREIAQPGGGVEVGDVLLQVGGVDVRGASAARVIGVAWSEMSRAGELALDVRRDRQRVETRVRIPATIPKWPALLVSLAFGVTGVLGLLRFPTLRVVQVAFPPLMAMALWTGSYFGDTPSELLAAFGLRAGSLLFLQPLSVRLMRHFPDGREGAPWAKGWPALLGLNGVILVDATISDALPDVIQHVVPTLLTLAAPLLLAGVGIARYRTATRNDRRRFKWLLLGVLVGSAPGALVSLSSAFRPELGAWFLPSQGAQLAVPLCLLIAITRHKLFDIDRLLNVTSVALGVVAAFLVPALLLGPEAQAGLVELGLTSRTATLSLAMGMLALALPLAMAGLRRLDAWVLRERREREGAVRALLARISGAGKLREIGVLATEGVASVWKLRGAAAWVCADERATPLATHDTLPGDWLRVLDDAALEALAARAGPVLVDDLLSQVPRLEPLRGHLLLPVPAPGGSQLAAGVLVAPRRDGEPFDRDDRALLALVAERVGAALNALDHRELLAQARAVARELGDRRRVAERESEEKSRMIATASHDVRQPLQALGIFLGTLESRVEGPEQQALVAQAQRAVAAMRQTFATLLDLTRLDAGVLVPRVEDVVLGDVLAEVCALLEPLAEAKGLALRVEAARLGVRTDPGLLQSILQNLVANAIRYTEEGEVVVRAARRDAAAQRRVGPGGSRALGVGGRKGLGAVVIEVVDSGRGIAEAERAAVFEAWRRGEDAGGDGEGVGLGLAIVARLSALLGHDVDVDSEPGRGTSFRLTLAAAPLPAPRRRPVPGELVAPLAGARIVVIDDDPATLTALVSLLESWGVDVVAGRDAASVLGPCAARSPDAALLDYALGSATGLEALATLESHIGAPLPCAILTGESDSAVQAEVAARGHPLLRKPAPPVRIRAVLTSLIRRPGDVAR